MSHVQDEKMVSSGGSLSHDFLRLIWHLMKLMLLTSLLCATLLFLPHTTCRSTVGRVMVANNDSVSVSPLQDLLKGQTLGVQMLDTDSEMMRTMNEHSTLELKTVVIAETVVPYEDRHLLSVYVKQQLDASDVTSEAQMEAVLTMVNLAPMEAVLSKEEIGEKGSLRNSAVLALIKKYAENVHFMLIGVRAEPRLGLYWISLSQRNAWNEVLSRVLVDKIRGEARNYLWHRHGNEVSDHLVGARTEL